MTEFHHGLVIGKFYPPHAGHHYLIRAAAQHCAQVTVVCMAASHESIPLALRVAWLQESFREVPQVTVVGIVDDVPVDYDDPAVWLAHVALMREALAAADAQRERVAVDAVFTSESYGEELARHFGAVPVCLDQARVLYPVSATAVRRDPAAQWDFLTPAVQAWLCLRVVIVGAESTGKTTLAQNLARHFRSQGGVWTRTRWVPEFGREHSLNKLAVARGMAQASGTALPGITELQWSSGEFTLIAQSQDEWEAAAARASGPVLVCDTDAFATAIWHERYIGAHSSAVEALADAASPHRLYLLTDVEAVPFVQDGIRDGENIRHWMHGRFEARLQAAGLTHVRVRGDEAACLAQAVAAVEVQLRAIWQFAAPLG